MKKLLKSKLILVTLLFSGLIYSCVSDLDTSLLEAPKIDATSSIDKTADIQTKSNSPKYGSNLSAHGSNSNVATVFLGTAGDFAILSKTGITDVYKSYITGDVGTSPITGAALLLKCNEVDGTIYTVDTAGPIGCRLTNPSRLATAVGNMQAAYTDAAGRSAENSINNLGAGNIGGKTLTPGLYKWAGNLLIPTNITISGSATDTWILQVAGTLTMSSAVIITLSGGALAENIFWQTAGAVTLGTSSHFEGTILGKTSIAVQTGASINGRLLAQTAVTLQKNTVIRPK